MAGAIRSPLDALDAWLKPNSDKVRMVRSKSGSNLAGWRSGRPAASPAPTAGGKGVNVAQHLAKKTPQVMVKISGAGKGMAKTKNHLDYISRNGQLELADQDGHVIDGRQGVNDIKDEWRAAGVPEESEKRECFNIVLGMPAGTPAAALKRAAQDFAEAEFGGHKYVMALHEPNTDQRTKNPHVHLCVVAVDEEGRRLNPRKDDLRRWRESFAEKLREQDVDALATSRRQHLQRQGPEGFKTRQRRQRQATSRGTQNPAKPTRPVKGRPNYEHADEKRIRDARRFAALYQSRAAKHEAGAATVAGARLRNLPAGHVVSDQGTQKQRAAQMFLQQDAPGRLGWSGNADHGMRRSGTGDRRNDGRGNERLMTPKTRFEQQLKEGAAIFTAAAKELRKTDTALARQLESYSKRAGVADRER
ncbi:MAG: hypothetical protein FWD50_03275 [Betaproteobacteria bacterium]|nr:hypothetical protein [Betaproteobacteria bacterium]